MSRCESEKTRIRKFKTAFFCKTTDILAYFLKKVQEKGVFVNKMYYLGIKMAFFDNPKRQKASGQDDIIFLQNTILMRKERKK